MNKLYRVISGKYWKFEKIFEEEESIEISKTFCIITLKMWLKKI